MKYLPSIFSVALLVAAPYASAGFVKCVDANGKTTYTDGFCPQTAPSARQANETASLKTEGRAVISAGLERIYSDYIIALHTNNWQAYLDTLTSRRREEAQAAGERQLDMQRYMAPTNVHVVEESVSKDGRSGMLKVKAVIPLSGSDDAQLGTVEFVREDGDWKIDTQAWSDREWVRAKDLKGAALSMQAEGCADVKARPESLPNQEMMKVSFKETQVAKFELMPGGTKDVSFPATRVQKISYRVAFNNALKCKYKGDYPTGMSMDGGKTWIYSFHAGQSVKPKDGQIKLAFRNKGQEPMNLVVVTE